MPRPKLAPDTLRKAKSFKLAPETHAALASVAKTESKSQTELVESLILAAAGKPDAATGNKPIKGAIKHLEQALAMLKA